MNLCSVCAGEGKPTSGLECVCGGLGTADAEMHGLRMRVLELETLLDEAEDWVASPPWVRMQISEDISANHVHDSGDTNDDTSN